MYEFDRLELNKYLSQQISKRFKNKQSQTINGYGTKQKLRKCIYKSQYQNGTKKEEKRSQKLHSSNCLCLLTRNRSNKRNKYRIIYNKQYQHLININNINMFIGNHLFQSKKRKSKKTSNKINKKYYNNIGENIMTHSVSYKYQELYDKMNKMNGYIDSYYNYNNYESQESDNNFIIVSWIDKWSYHLANYCHESRDTLISFNNVMIIEPSLNPSYKIRKLEIGCYCFAGHIELNHNFIKIDDSDLDKKQYWNKNIYFDKTDLDDLQNGLYGKERVLFDIEYYCGPYKSISKAVNIRLPKQSFFASMDNVHLLISGYISLYLNRYTMYLPPEIQDIIGWYYYHYQLPQIKCFSQCDIYFINHCFKLHHQNNAALHNVIFSEMVLKNNEKYSFKVRLLKLPAYYYGIGIMSHPEKVMDYLTKHENQLNWWKPSETEICVWNEMKLTHWTTNDIFELIIDIENYVGTLQLYRNCKLSKTIYADIDDLTEYYPYFCFDYRKCHKFRSNDTVHFEIWPVKLC